MIHGLGGNSASQLEFSPSGCQLAYVSRDGGIHLRDGTTGDFICILDCGSGGQVRFKFQRGGSRLASLTTGYRYSLRLWDTENGKLVGVAEDVDWVTAISDDGSLVATRKGTDEVQLWSGSSLSLIETLIFSLAFSPDLLAIGCILTVKLYDLKSRAFIPFFAFPSARSLSFSPDHTTPGSLL